MLRIDRVQLTAAAMICSIIAGLSMIHEPARDVAAQPAITVDATLLQSGDLIFRRGRTLTSRAVLTVDGESHYSHVGIVSVDEHGPVVIHAVPGGHAGQPHEVQVEPVAAFASRAQATSVTVRRLGDVTVAAHAAARARSYSRDRVIFDSEFDLSTRDRMYCTELVWRAYEEAGVDLVDGRLDEIHLPFGERRLILPSSLLRSTVLHEVLTRSND